MKYAFNFQRTPKKTDQKNLKEALDSYLSFLMLSHLFSQTVNCLSEDCVKYVLPTALTQ